MKDNVARPKYSENGNVLSLLLKEERVPEVLGESVPDVRAEVKLQALVYDILPSRRKVPESGARSEGRSVRKCESHGFCG